MMVSISRRCDIPRFRFGWLRERIEAGFTEVRNPFNDRQVRRVSLLPEDAEVLAFWTRDPGPLLEHADMLEARGHRFYAMITLTGYPPLLEPGAPPADRVIAAMRGLAGKLGPDRVIWRYDPVFLSSLTGPGFHREKFRELSGALSGAVRRVVVSVYDSSPRAAKRLGLMEAEGLLRVLPHYGVEGRLIPEARNLLGELAEIAGKAGIAAQSCAEEDLTDLGIARGACIDGGLIRELWGIEIPGRDRNQRPLCGCAPSVDIGAYGPCPAGCAYCYAR